MNYEEKRELRLQISQLLADAGLNQGSIKEMVEQEITAKVDRAVDQCFKHLNAQSSSDNFVQDRIIANLNNNYLNNYAFSNCVKEVLNNRVVQIVLKDCEVGEE